MKICDAIIVMYSITDRVSFHVARELLEDLANLGDIICPVLLMANKLDLHHHRKVSACLLFSIKSLFVLRLPIYHYIIDSVSNYRCTMPF